MENHRMEIDLLEYKFLKEQLKEYTEQKRQLYEYMGYEDEFLITRASLKSLNKDHLSLMVLEQRNMIRRLIDDLVPEKREAHMQFLDDLYMSKERVK